MMNQQRPTKRWLVLFVSLLFLSGLACKLGSTPEATPTPAAIQATPEPAPTGTAVLPTPIPDQPEPTPEPEPEITIEQLQAATVQIFAKFNNRGRLQTQWTGSGTIISPDGLVLTNAHVAAPKAAGLAVLYNDPELLFSEEPDALVVALVERADAPPVETYLAEVAVADGTLDLAVIRIVSTLDGSPVDAAGLNLPFVELGDSDTISLGDEVRVLGFPGAGGETITFTRGDVAGFESQDLVGNRAWIKTDTTVSPGNSGGLGANAAGQIVGVPSFVQEALGGAINRLRAINFALPLVDAARQDAAYDSPYVMVGSGKEKLALVTWAEDFQEEDGCPINPVDAYPSGVLATVAIFKYEGMTDGEQTLVGWFNGDDLVLANVISWSGGNKGECFATYVHNYGDPLPEGTYTVEVYAGTDLGLIATAETTVGGAGTAVSGGVQMQGQITDVDTGKPIEGAVVFVLNPDVDLDAWLDDPQDDDIYTLADTDANGDYALPDLLERGFVYPGVAAARGYRPNDGNLDINNEDPEILVIDLQLSK